MAYTDMAYIAMAYIVMVLYSYGTLAADYVVITHLLQLLLKLKGSYMLHETYA